MTAGTPHRIVIVGGGAGGLPLASRLGDQLGRRGRAEVTLVDRKDRHLWKPLLHEVAAGRMDADVHGVGEIGELVGENVGIGDAHHHRAHGLRQRATVAEVAVLKMRVPVEIVVDGVILAALVFTAIADIDAGYAEVVNEHGVVRA